MWNGKTKNGVELRRLDGVGKAKEKNPWIVVADRSRVRVFEALKHENGERKLELIEEIDLPRPHSHSREEALAELMRRTGHYLESELSRHRYETLDVFADPHVLGTLRETFPSQVLAKVVRYEDKDFARLTQHDLARRFVEGETPEIGHLVPR